MSIDTLEFVKTLESAGVERKVAEADVKAISAHVVPEIATRADLDRVEQKLEQKIETVVRRMEATVWKAAIATMGGVLAIGSLHLRFLR
jgi:hypothetical protein